MLNGCSEIPEAKRRFCRAVTARAQGSANSAAQTEQWPQDPNDDPAEKWLERIGAKREIAAPVRLKSKKTTAALQQKAKGGRRSRAS